MGRRQFAWFLLGFAAASLLGVLLGPVPARAQESLPLRSTFPAGPSLPSTSRQPSADLDDNYAAPGIPPPVPSDDPTAETEESDGLDPVPGEGQRAVVQDGDPNYPSEPTQPLDGVVDVSEPVAPQDGTDPSVVDTRDTEDIADFENPPAGYNPLLFQVEDVDPAKNDRLVRRLASLDPYDPVGIRIGSFVLFPEAEIGSSSYSNVFRAPNAVSDWALDLAPAARLVSNWDRHALEFRAIGDLSYYGQYDSENDRAYQLETRGRLDFTSRTNLQAIVNRQFSQESRSALDALSVGSRANQTVDHGEASFNHRFNRLSLQFRGSVSDYTFGDVQNAGQTFSNADRDYTSTEETGRVSWEFKPTLSAFTEVAVNQRNYGEVAQTDLINRSSDGQRYRFGLSFGNTGRILRGEISLGYGVQTPDDHRLKSLDGLIIDGNVAWRVTELTSLLFYASSDVSETTTVDVGGAFYRYLGLEARHAFRPYLIGSAGLSYTTQNSQDGIIDDKEYRATLGAEYYLNRETSLFTRYAHTKFNAIGIESDYSSDEVHIGMIIRR